MRVGDFPKCRRGAVTLALLITLAPMSVASWAGVRAGAPALDQKDALRLSQAAVGRRLDDYVLRDRNGRTVHLRDYRGKPLLVSVVYTSCYHVCSTATRQLAEAVRVARQTLGKDSFRVVTVGFDTVHDTPQAMADFARRQGVDLPGWAFLSGDAATVSRLLDAVGFTYAPSAKGFDHLIQTTVVDADGRIDTQVYGDAVYTRSLVDPLKRLVFGGAPNAGVLTNLTNKVRLFCTTYDPATGTYRFDYSLFMGMAIGGIVILLGILFLAREWRRNRRLRRSI